jgi:putative ABC transport system permease protein
VRRQRRRRHATPWTTLGQGAATAAETVASHRLRSALTFLGVTIGALSVLAIAAYGQYASAQVSSILAQFGSNLVTVRPSAPQTSGARVGQVRTLTVDDAQAIREQIPQLLAVSGVRGGSITAIAGAYSVNTQAAGVSADYPSIQGLQLRAGAFFGPADEQTTTSVVVLGSHAAAQLFGEPWQAMDQSVRINGNVARVVGVLAPRGQTINGNLDDVIYLPLSTALRRVFGGTHLDRIEVRAVDGKSVAPTMASITSLLKSRHRIAPSKPDDFEVQSQQQIVQRATQSTAAVSTGLTAGAALALAIAGFGVMNIMLVSVSERTPEIGVRLAVGARGADVRAQFLSEALALCGAGAAIGCGIGLVSAHVVSQRVGMSVVPDPIAFVVAGATSVAIGVAFGWYPAERAARLDPIAALQAA